MFIIGKKLCMSQVFDSIGNAVPVTLISAGPCFISQIKSKKNSGYNAIELSYSENKKKRNYIKEFKFKNVLGFKLGQKITIISFKIGEYVNISGLTIGKGNTSNIKRNRFTRGPMSHGSKHHRLQGSLGAGTSPGRVFPGKKMPGRVGMRKCTIKNLKILFIDNKNNILIIKGSIPGKRGNLVKLSAIDINKNIIENDN